MLSSRHWGNQTLIKINYHKLNEKFTLTVTELPFGSVFFTDLSVVGNNCFCRNLFADCRLGLSGVMKSGVPRIDGCGVTCLGFIGVSVLVRFDLYKVPFFAFIWISDTISRTLVL